MDSYQWVRDLTPESPDWAHKQLAQELDKLRAEVERLTHVCQDYQTENASLVAENESLSELVRERPTL